VYKKEMLRLAAIVLLTSLLTLAAGVNDPFERIKGELAASACTHVRFLSVVHSEVFESVDTIAGQAYVAQDGRYAITLGSDTYVQTGDRLYAYSEEQNQVTVQYSDVRAAGAEEVSFLNRLDEFYTTGPVQRGIQYRLDLSDTATALPDSMWIYLKSDTAGVTAIDRLEFFDSNEDLNQIVLLSLDLLNRCDSLSLRPSFPDTVEIITLP
jgi:hypothetical protein